MKIPCKRKIRILEPRYDNVLFSGIFTRSETNRAVQPRNMVLGVRFWIKAEDRLKDLCGENKDADQLRGDRTADRNNFFLHIQKQVFLIARLTLVFQTCTKIHVQITITKTERFS